MTKYITDGFARALNQLALNQLDEEYTFCVPANSIQTFIPLLRDAYNGKLLESATGMTHHWMFGTDVTICLDLSPSPTDICIPAHRTTLKWILSL